MPYATCPVCHNNGTPEAPFDAECPGLGSFHGRRSIAAKFVGALALRWEPRCWEFGPVICWGYSWPAEYVIGFNLGPVGIKVGVVNIAPDLG